MTAILVALIVVGGLVMMALIVTVGLLIEEGKLGKKTAAKKAEEASIAAMYRAKEALYREAENRVLHANPTEPLDMVALELLGMKFTQQQKQIHKGDVLPYHGGIQ